MRVIEQQRTRSGFAEVVEELSDLLGHSHAEVEERVWREALQVGHNVSAAAQSFGLEPHVYSARMEEFYRTTDAFVYETVVESHRPGKRAVMERIAARLEHKLATSKAPLDTLMLGDGSGSDTLWLFRRFGPRLRLFYFDVPGSVTYDFAMRRFDRGGVEVRHITEYKAIPRTAFDVLLSLEVLEHLQDPVTAVRDMHGFLRPTGIALVTESFNGVRPHFPTHLASNRRFDRLQYMMFATAGLTPTYLHGKPMEFMKYEGGSMVRRLAAISPQLALKYVLAKTGMRAVAG